MLSSKKLYFTTIDSNNMHNSALLYQIHTFKSKTKIIKKYSETFAIQGFDKDGSKKPVKSRLCGQQQAMRQLKLNKFTEQGYRFHQWYPFSVAPH